MKAITSHVKIIACLPALAAALTLGASADEPAAKSKPNKTYTGMVVSVDAKEHTLELRKFLLTKKFNLGDHCAFTVLEQSSGSVNDLRPGQNVMVRYQNADGVLVAERVEQQPLRYEGTVKAIDPATHKLTLHLRAGDQTLMIADDCKVMLRDNKSGTMADIQPGHRVTVLYEKPPGAVTARQIAQTSAVFTGTLTAIDLSERTLKAKAMLDSKKFNLADGCQIVLNGKTDGQLRDLKPGEKLTFSYDEVNGINVVNRIASAVAAETTEPVTAQSAQSAQ